MTLRGSEQSLLHNFDQAGSREPDRARSPLFPRTILICSTLLAITLAVAFQAVEPIEKQFGNENLRMTTGFDSGPNVFWSNEQSRKASAIEGDVVITPLENPFKHQYRQLTVNSEQPFLSPYEISNQHAMEMLAGSGNIAITNELKFFTNGTSNNIAACPSKTALTGPVGHKNSECFLIEIQPLKGAGPSLPDVL